ncbi:MAG: VirB8/TrbF family protein [Rickettsiales bacterium]
MAEEDKVVAESIRSGKYFAESRAWFNAVYIGPISERTFFLLIAVLSVLVTIFALSALSSLLPLTPKAPILIRSGERSDEVQLSLVPIEKSKADSNPALAKFFVLRYVQARESYIFQSFSANALFIRSQSNEGAYAIYASAYNPANPESPFANLGENGQRLVSLRSVRNNFTGTGGTAEVEFTVETRAVDEPSKTKWTAKLEYLYTGMTTEPVKNAETGKQELKISDPQFQVVNYVLEQTK